MNSVQPSFHKISISTPKKEQWAYFMGRVVVKKSRKVLWNLHEGWGKPKNLHWGNYRFFVMLTFSLLHCYAFIVRHFHQYYYCVK